MAQFGLRLQPFKHLGLDSAATVAMRAGCAMRMLISGRGPPDLTERQQQPRAESGTEAHRSLY